MHTIIREREKKDREGGRMHVFVIYICIYMYVWKRGNVVCFI